MSDTLLGVEISGKNTRFAIYSSTATQIWLCLFDQIGTHETARILMVQDGDIFSVSVPDLTVGQLYGYRVDGLYDPDQGLFHDPAKLLADPYATRFNRPWSYDPRLSAPRAEEVNTAPLVPKAVLEKPVYKKPKLPLFKAGGLIYEANVRAMTMLHPDVPEKDRGTVRALAHPSIIAHLTRIGVDAIELMPVTAWIDERHLAPLGLSNAWGYNPVAMMAVDPRLCPNGISDLRFATDVLRKAGIGVILDLVFNHTGESDRFGPVVSMRGIDNHSYYRHVSGQAGLLINDAGTGNTLQCDRKIVSRLIIDSLRHFVLAAGVDGFRFDLAPILGRTAAGFDANAALLIEMQNDDVLADRILIAEPWDIGPGGYQVGNFPEKFLEWNDRARDDLRCFWRGDGWKLGALATRIAGSADMFGKNDAKTTRTVNFLAAHDGFTLADMVAYEHKHNDANGEHNRDGHNENHSWNNGVEGDTTDTGIIQARKADLKALLSTLFATRGSIMLTAGDEFGRTQHGNNNAYAQDNPDFWVNWAARDLDLENHVAALAKLRRGNTLLQSQKHLAGKANIGLPDVEWLRNDGSPMQTADWDAPDAGSLTMVLAEPENAEIGRLAVVFNRTRETIGFNLPKRRGFGWRDGLTQKKSSANIDVAPRSVVFAEEF
jgi:glycogen debranching enzyme